eukprot:CAMPEP_0202343186 /NCGR_PEP_ID=MMETSP1126-20121109/3419_1 /ASSEMBLY_ACC=CAM_ASM_000457 /TAXON_ID=3047 /ORGANISM="Dunaliella tertiolecta, Strain CCMP1320" /LENGTH=662 /DNA_ID=CAMNT_0048934227 /DNA_START=1282 /DNA_END=3267 /DNA_ORIENTATION=-
MTLGKRSDYGDSKFAGLEVPFPGDVDRAVQDTLLCGFDFIVTPLVRPGHKLASPSAPSTTHSAPPPLSFDDVLYMDSSQWVRQVVGSVSGWIDPDSPEEQEASHSAKALQAELGWAAHLGIQAVLLPPIKHPLACTRFAQIANQTLEGITQMAMWLTVPIDHPPNGVEDGQQQQQQGTGAPGPFGSVAADPWETWNQFRSLCAHDTLLGCVLKLGPQLPPPQQLQRWLAEPVRAILLPTHVFTTNKKGYPVLPKPHQELLSTMFNMSVQVIVTGECVHQTPQPVSLPPNPTPAELAAAAQQQQQNFISIDPTTGAGFTINNPGEAHPLRPYWEYLSYLFRKLPVLGSDEQLEADYRDYLQAPLQPLQDNLESATYEVFEKDTIKYVQYEEAVYRALCDRKACNGGKASPVVLMVVGAGRGPLVSASMRASARSQVPLRVYAVEKNANAVVHIQALLRREGWQDKVTIVTADMRTWQAPEPADILVSELLGSFGDNELSPECLDGAQRFLGPQGISIPANYTSFMAPVSCHKLWNDVKAYNDREHFETPYVAKFHRHYVLAPTQEMFSFSHPNRATPIDNNRHKRVVYTRPVELGSAIMHGFAGYFESELYKGVWLSTHPPTHTPNMSSWFPIYFPLKEPIYVPAGASVEASMWRCSGAHKVW